ncbi:BglG family transcription antiterminator [Salinicoccus sesuvii]|uniref:BglG family transcription antiterminator n=1 Tax=Salinicoccus sesuvii TaxID=868281 RepID=A0ABV7NA41_9STAP
MFTPRQKHIISYLLRQKDFTQIKVLAKMFNVSERTIQYDMEHIEHKLLELEVSILRHKMKGVLIETSSDIKGLISGTSDPSIKYYSAEERFEQILLSLLESVDPISSSRFAENLNVSRRTIVDDLKVVESWLRERNLELVYEKNKGFRVQGNERQFRESYVEILVKHYQELDIPFHLKYAGKSSIPKIYNAIETGLRNKEYSLIQNSIDGLVFHLAITLHRIENNFKIEMPEEQLVKLQQEKEFDVALSIKCELERIFDIKFPLSEAGYITLHLLGARQTVENNFFDFEKDAYLKDIIEYFLQSITRTIGVDITKDQELLQGLIVHLRPAIYRLKYNFRNENPIKGDIYDRYPDIIYAIETSIFILQEKFEITFNDDEIAFIAIHIGAAIEKKSNQSTNYLNVLLICGSGIGTSQLLKTRMASYYPELNVTDTLAYSNLNNDYLNNKEIDLIVSTIYMDEQSVPVVNVSPFLNKEDRDRLNHIINTQREKVVEKIVALGPTLNRLLPSRYIEWDVEAKDWRNAIYKAVELLSNDSLVRLEYAEEIIQQIDHYGPYMVIRKNVALIHASYKKGINQTAYSFVKLSKPVAFGHDTHDPVSYIICLATTSPKIHLNALRQLSLILMDELYMSRIGSEGKAGLLKRIEEVSKL